MKNYSLLLKSTGVVLALSLAACAHERMVTPEQVAATQAPLRAAEEAGADQIPEAALYMKLARDQVKEADKLAEEEDEREGLLRARAAADAELALALAQQKKISDEATAALEQAEAEAKTN